VVGTVRLWDVGFTRVISPLEGEVFEYGNFPLSGLLRKPPLPCVAGARKGASLAAVASSPLTKWGRGVEAKPRRRGGKAVCDFPAHERALLLGPLAVEPSVKGGGIGSALMRHAIAEATRLGHRAILLVGDEAYYRRFGFSAQKTASLAMSGPYERHRFLALELADGALDGACGVLRPAGRTERLMRAA
jgi:hypothetical protein